MATLYHSKRKSQTVLNNGGSLSSGGVSVTVLSAAALPAAPYLAYIEPGVIGQEELIAVTSVASNTLTIVRGLDGTAGVAHPDGSAIKNLTASLAWEDLLTIFQAHAHTGSDSSAALFFDATAPVLQNFGDVAAVGSATTPAHRDHVHGMPLYPGYFNALYNGDFSVAQLGTTATMVNAQAFLDGWHSLNTSAAVLTHNQLTSPTTAVGSMNLSSYAYINTAGADVSIAAGDLAGMYQQIEGWDARELVIYGAAFSGWFYSNRGGVFALALANRDSTWSFIREFTLVANTWTYVTTTFPSGYGTIGLTGDWRTQRGLYFYIMLAAGTTYQTPAGVWTNANKVAGPNITNNIDSNLNQFYHSGLNLVPGSQPQPFAPVSYAQQLARCKRYRQIVSVYPDSLGVAQAVSTIQFYGAKQLEVEMIGTPTMTISSAAHWSAFNASAGNITVATLSFTPTNRMINYSGTVASGLVAGNAAYVYAANSSARLYAEAYPA